MEFKQWGLTKKVSDESTNTYTLNISYSSANYIVVFGQYGPHGDRFTNGFSVTAITTSSFTGVSWNYGQPVFWISIGS